MHISRRAHHIQASPIRKLKPYADKAKERGTHVYHLNIGDPDVPTPRPVLDAFHAYNEAVIGYGPSQGFIELRQAMTRYFGTYGISLQADDILVTTGGSEAIHFAFSVVGDPGDEILIPEPFYTNYNGYRLVRLGQHRPHPSRRRGRLPSAVRGGHRGPPHPEDEGDRPLLAQQSDGHRLLARGARPRRPAGREARPVPHRGRGLQGIHLRRADPQEPPRVRRGPGQGHRRRQHLQAVQLLRGPDRRPHHRGTRTSCRPS